MSNVRALHAFSHNEPLRTIVEVANSDYEPTERGDSRAQQYEDIPGPEAARRGRDEWQSWASDISDTSGDVDDDQGSVKNGRGPKSGQAGPRTR